MKPKYILCMLTLLCAVVQGAREAGAQTMDEVRRAMRLDYFADATFAAEQAAKFAQS